jgi:hypothetical protein
LNVVHAARSRYSTEALKCFHDSAYTFPKPVSQTVASSERANLKSALEIVRSQFGKMQSIACSPGVDYWQFVELESGDPRAWLQFDSKTTTSLVSP